MQAGDQQRSAITAIVDDLKEVSALLGVERLRALIIDDHSNGYGLGLAAAQYDPLPSGFRSPRFVPRHGRFT